MFFIAIFELSIVTVLNLMNAIIEASALMAPVLARNHLSSCCFTSLSQAISCANQFFMEGLNAQIVARDKSEFLVVSPDIASRMYTEGFQLIYGN